MKQWNLFGLTAIVLLIPMLFIYYGVRTGILKPATMGIPFYTCMDSNVCPDMPARDYKTIQLPLKTIEAETKLRNEIRKLGQVHDTIHGYHFILNDSNVYNDFIQGIDVCHSAGANIIHNESGFWIYYATESETKAFFEKLRKECPQLGPLMTCK